jgi:hypothetical protein
VANRTAGLSVLDIRNPANPVLVGSLRIPGGDAMVVNVLGSRAYVADYPIGFRIIDIGDPTHPALLGTALIPKSPSVFPQSPDGIHVVGNYAHCAGGGGLYVFDVRDPQKPVLVSGLRNFGGTRKVQIVQHNAFVATSGKGCGLLVFDMADPALPQVVDGLMIETNNLPIISRSSRTNFMSFGYTRMLGDPKYRAYVEKHHSTDMPRTMNEIVANLRDSPEYCQYAHRNSGIAWGYSGLQVMERFALAWWGHLDVIDVTDVTQPKRISQYPIENQIWDVRGAGRYAYVMQTGPKSGPHILVIDLGDPAHPVEVAKFTAHNFASRVLAMRKAGKPTSSGLTEPTHLNVPAAVGPPELSDPQNLPDGAFAFTLSGVADATYVIHATADMVSWVPISTNTLPAGGRLRLIDADAASRTHQFYRAVMQ